MDSNLDSEFFITSFGLPDNPAISNFSNSDFLKRVLIFSSNSFKVITTIVLLLLSAFSSKITKFSVISAAPSLTVFKFSAEILPVVTAVYFEF
jgi:hypothetical protein